MLMKPGEVADMLAISKRKLWELTNTGNIPSVRIGRCVRYDRKDILDWIEMSKRKGSPGSRMGS